MKKANLVSGSNQGPVNGASSLGNSLEIKDSYLPPWIISYIVAALSSLGSFEARYIRPLKKFLLNVAL